MGQFHAIKGIKQHHSVNTIRGSGKEISWCRDFSKIFQSKSYITFV